jgi:glycerophosphoryl diester phosphodiesterase
MAMEKQSYLVKFGLLAFLFQVLTSSTAFSQQSLKSGYHLIAHRGGIVGGKGKIGIMIDNKISGKDTVLFTKVIDLLKQYDLFRSALMIGTDESTDFFTGKIKLSCTRKQI